MKRMSKKALPKPPTLPKSKAPPKQQSKSMTAYRRKLDKMSPDQLMNEAEDAIGDTPLDQGYYAK